MLMPECTAASAASRRRARADAPSALIALAATTLCAAARAITVTLPPPVTVQAVVNETAVVTVAAPVVAGAVGAVSLNCPGAGTPVSYPLGTTALHCTATDAGGHGATATTSVTVVDTIAPVLTMFAPITVTATTLAGAVVTVPKPVATDKASVPTVTCNASSGAALYPVGITTVSCTAKDGGGNLTTRTATVTVLPPAVVGNATAYRITDLGTLAGFASSAAFGINAYGQVSGSASTDTGVGSGNIHGFLWTPVRANVSTGTFTDLGAATTGLANGMKVNNYGQVIVNVGAPSEVAWLWTPTKAHGTAGAAVPLLGAGVTSAGFGLNNLGQVVGGGGPAGPFVWTPNLRNGTTGAINFTVAQGSNGPYDASGYNCHCVPTGINDAGVVAGYLYYGPYGRHTLHHNGGVTFPAQNPYNFGTIGVTDVIAPPADAGQYVGSGGFESVKAFGHAAGSRIYGDAFGHVAAFPVYWDGLVFRIVGPGLSAHAINNRDAVVGETWLAKSPGQSGGFLYSKGVLTELHSLVDAALGWRIDHASAINDSGQIVGDGLHNGVRHAYLLTPIVVNVSTRVAVATSVPVLDAVTHRWIQTVIISNPGGAAVVGPVSLVLTNLSSGVTLANATGVTSVVAPVGRPYIDAAVASIPAGATVTLTLKFNDATGVPINYAPQVLAGIGPR